MTNNKPFKDFGDLMNKYFPNDKVQKITINAGFTCPNRDGLKAIGGCTYCNNKSFSPRFSNNKNKTITQQLKENISFFSYKYPKTKYLAYFQSYTNTYDETNKLISLYEEALSYPNVVGLIIGTRPDCMSSELLDYFEELSTKTFVLIEYGVESTLNTTLEFINRQHTYEDSKNTIIKTANKNILTGAHLILGLPHEDKTKILNHADELARLPLTTLKLHQLQIIKGTLMALQYKSNPEWFTLFNMDEYFDICIAFAERLPPDLIIERFISQSPPSLLIAPKWGIKNVEFTHKIYKKFKENKTWQGRLYNII